MDNFRDSYFQVDWDLSTKRLKGTYWGKQYDTGRGFAITVINGGQVVTPTNEVLRLKWEKPDKTAGYVNATIVNGKFIIENIDQMFTVHGSVRADFELSVGGEFVASITFYVTVEKAVAVDAIESSSEFTALQTAITTVDGLDAQLADITQQLEDGTAGIDDNVVSESKVWSSAKTKTEIDNFALIPSVIYISETEPSNPQEGAIWFKVGSPVTDIPVTDYLFRFDASRLNLENGVKVDTWEDISGNGNDLMQSETSEQPLFLQTGFNDKPTVQFNNTFMEKSLFTLDKVDGATVFIVGELDSYDSSATIQAIGNIGTTVRTFYTRISGSEQRIVNYFNGTNSAYMIIDESKLFYGLVWDGTRGTTYKNGTHHAEAPYVGTIGSHNTLRLGKALGSTPEPFYGRISEYIYFSRALDTEEIAQINSFLKQKWGL